MDWKEDRWFASHHYKNLNDDFKQWWLGYYGLPEEYDDTHEYWTRCAFSLVGWNNKTT